MWTLAASVTDKYDNLQEHFYQRSRKYAQMDEMRGHGETTMNLAHCQSWILTGTYEFKQMYFPRAWLSVGRAVRFAQMFQLHRLDGASLDVKQCLPPPKDWTEREERRRTFWMAFCIDRYASIGTGWPMTIDERDIKTNLPASEEAFEKSKEMSTGSLDQVLDHNGEADLQSLGGTVFTAAMFGRNLLHLHRPAPDDNDGDINGGYWNRHRHIEQILLQTSLGLPDHLRLPYGLTDPNVVFANMCIHTSAICLHQAAIFKADKHHLPASVGNESKIRCLTAAAEIASIMRMISHMDMGAMNPFISFCVYVAARVFAQYLKTRPNDQQIKSSLRFLLQAMQALRRKNPLTESFLAQLDVDLETAGIQGLQQKQYMSPKDQLSHVPASIQDMTESIGCHFQGPGQMLARNPRAQPPLTSTQYASTAPGPPYNIHNINSINMKSQDFTSPGVALREGSEMDFSGGTDHTSSTTLSSKSRGSSTSQSPYSLGQPYEHGISYRASPKLAYSVSASGAATGLAGFASNNETFVVNNSNSLGNMGNNAYDDSFMMGNGWDYTGLNVGTGLTPMMDTSWDAALESVTMGWDSVGPSQDEQKQTSVTYLQDLRTNRPARPTGARPAPAHFNTWSNRASNRMSDSHTVASLQRTFADHAADADARPASSHEPKRHSRTPSKLSIDEVVKGPGRPVVQPPRGRNTSRSSSPSRISSVQYREREQRQVEQDEARAIRVAMEDLELAQEEKLFEAARDEAAELVWKHCNPHAAENNPNAPYSYPGLAKKGSAPRSRSVEPKDQDLQRANSKLRKRHSMSSAASGSRSSSLQSNGQGGSTDTSASNTSSTKGKKDESPALAKAISDLPDFKQRRRSSGARRTTSGSLFQNPNDQIYEEPEEEAPPAPVRKPAVTAEPPKSEKLPLGIRRNPFMRFQSIKGNPMMRSNTDPTMASKRLDRYEIQKNPPTQSRNAAYTLNSGEAKPAEPAKADVENVPEVKMKDGKEIRSDELRAATGFRLKDRSPKLPTPTAVSDAPGRPIVSFKKDWNIIELKEEISAVPDLTPRPLNPNKSGPPPLEHAATAPVVPTISLAPDVPTRSTTPRPPANAEAKRSSVLAPEVPNRSTTPRPTTPSSRNAAPTSWIGRQAKPVINIYEDPPAPAPTRPLPLVSSLRKANIPTRPSASPVPTINVSESPSARSRTTPAPPIPSISVSETPSISVNGPTSRRSHTPSTVATPPSPAYQSRKRTQWLRTSRIYATTANPKCSQQVAQLQRYSYQSRWSLDTNHCPYRCSMYPMCSAYRWPYRVCRWITLPPECFACYQCGEHLECVAFYPEPSNKHAERVHRIRARLSGQDIPYLPSHATAEDMARLEHDDGTDESPRFYCHLDFHELFSPRCKSCKTPIEGEVIVACGAEWHAGHFFCAQCGDPFDSTTPFVEKDGYAWCALVPFKMAVTFCEARVKIRFVCGVRRGG
ncbi:hypothetical protein CFE70_001937 [Pyrenophora teres f. teres 0-1]